MDVSKDVTNIQNDVSQLFVDDALVSSKKGIVRTLHPARKLDEPVLVGCSPNCARNRLLW